MITDKAEKLPNQDKPGGFLPRGATLEALFGRLRKSLRDLVGVLLKWLEAPFSRLLCLSMSIRSYT
jgi:hypothetical protein